MATKKRKVRPKSLNRKRLVSSPHSTTPIKTVEDLKKSIPPTKPTNEIQKRTTKTCLAPIAIGGNLDLCNTALSSKVEMSSTDHGLQKEASNEDKENQMYLAAKPMDIETAMPVVSSINNNIHPGSVVARKPIDGNVAPTLVKQDNPAPIDSEVPYTDLTYSVGDVVWAYIFSSPLWPALISIDPTENVFTKIKSRFIIVTSLFCIILLMFVFFISATSKSEVKFYHVQFFGDKASHSWLASHFLFPFEGGVDELMINKHFMTHVGI